MAAPPVLYTCALCGQDGLTDPDMRSHMVVVHQEETISCPFCTLGGVSYDEMELHINTVHTDDMDIGMEEAMFIDEEMEREKRNGEKTEEEKETSDTRDSCFRQDGALSLEEEDGACLNQEFRMSVCENDEGSEDDGDLGAKGRERIVVKSKSWSDNGTLAADSESEEELEGSSDKRRRLEECDVQYVSDSDDDVENDNHVQLNNDSHGNPRKKDSPMTQYAKNGLSTDSSPTTSTSESLSPESIIKYSNRNQENTSPRNPHHGNPHPWHNGENGKVHSGPKTGNPHKKVDIPKSKIMKTSEQKANINITDSELGALASRIEDEEIGCPFCNIRGIPPVDLNAHVNRAHADLLSPEKAGPSNMAQFDNDTVCPMCGLQGLEGDLFAQHVEGHFQEEQRELSDHALAAQLQEQEEAETRRRKQREEEEFRRLQARYGMDNQGNYRSQSMTHMERAVARGQMSTMEYHKKKAEMAQTLSSGKDDGKSCVRGIVQRLRAAYASGIYGVRQVFLAASVDHFSSSWGDKGWGCGYRNIQMMLSALFRDPAYRDVLVKSISFMPSIPKIQQMIEEAWSRGFDREGSEQLGGKLRNTRKWIGATEVAALFSSLGVRAQVVDFHHPTAADGSHPQLFDWTKNHFRQEGAGGKHPLYLQHQGHSRTIIGYEEHADGSGRLLIFDPGHNPKQIEPLAHGKITGTQLRVLRRTMSGLKHRQYQIVAIRGVLSNREVEGAKVIQSVRIP
ncbi:zinc finger-containing ubiquitin peptidase 1-like isoform X2 [Branchiostoma floridae]|nr:zinc finger-containing ubiquitin peptidase 1-like isoform X2 [Branchiostoma floridae]XP_035686206.1 zinc finger-containing ubiquitin peptidase 1-like isoform X2 [Branchiostoma floridae]XP_035686207.1 zinc finger-containing ubiquitin peptidase 1-like isoform X2 [Branchiostoma floridae]